MRSPALWFTHAHSAVLLADDACAHARDELQHPATAAREEEHVDEEDDEGRVAPRRLPVNHERQLQNNRHRINPELVVFLQDTFDIICTKQKLLI